MQETTAARKCHVKKFLIIRPDDIKKILHKALMGRRRNSHRNIMTKILS